MKSSVDTANLALCVPRPSSGQEPHNAVLSKSPLPTTTELDHILIQVDRFGFSANNVTYQALGEAPHFRYFEFHAAPLTNSTSPKTHGLIPVWGFGTVVWTSHPRIFVGERVYGYFAPVRYLLLPVSPSDVNKYAFHVPRPHLPADRRPYNQITRCATDPLYNPSPEAEDLTMLYRPLFWTSFWCADWLATSSFRGEATNFLITSASSKTAFCLAYIIRKRFATDNKTVKLNIVGLTSAKNSAFTKRLELYDRVLEYVSFPDSLVLTSHPAEGNKWIYVDVAGNDDLNARIALHFEKADSATLVAHITLGVTNLSPSSPEGASSSWTKNTSLLGHTQHQKYPSPSLPNSQHKKPVPAPEQFFMPEWLVLRRKQLTIAQITQMQTHAWADLMRRCPGWVKIERIYGGDGVLRAYNDFATNGVGPEKGLIWSLWDNEVESRKERRESKL